MITLCAPQLSAVGVEKPVTGKLKSEIRRREAPMTRARKMRPKPAPKRPAPPTPIVIQFRHIPVESFVETLEQLGKNHPVGRVLEQLPAGVNEHANAVVVVAPPELNRMLTAIAKGLDRPSGFHEWNRARERGEVEFYIEMKRRKQAVTAAPGGKWHVAKGRGGPRGRVVSPWGAGGKPPYHGPAYPAGMIGALKMLASPQAVKALSLEPEQAAKIRELLGKAVEREAKITRRVVLERQERMIQLRKQVFGMLKGEKRKAAERLLRQHKPQPEPASHPPARGAH